MNCQRRGLKLFCDTGLINGALALLLWQARDGNANFCKIPIASPKRIGNNECSGSKHRQTRGSQPEHSNIEGQQRLLKPQPAFPRPRRTRPKATHIPCMEIKPSHLMAFTINFIDGPVLTWAPGIYSCQ